MADNLLEEGQRNRWRQTRTTPMTPAHQLPFEADAMEAKAKILVVDDNAQNRALAQATLEDEGYEVVLADNGEAGLRAMESERPDCVLLDVRMPGTDGFARGLGHAGRVPDGPARRRHVRSCLAGGG